MRISLLLVGGGGGGDENEKSYFLPLILSCSLRKYWYSEPWIYLVDVLVFITRILNSNDPQSPST